LSEEISAVREVTVCGIQEAPEATKGEVLRRIVVG